MKNWELEEHIDRLAYKVEQLKAELLWVKRGGVMFNVGTKVIFQGMDCTVMDWEVRRDAVYYKLKSKNDWHEATAEEISVIK